MRIKLPLLLYAIMPISLAFPQLSAAQACALMTQSYFDVLPAQLALLYEEFTALELAGNEEMLPFLFFRLRDKIEALMRFEQFSLFPGIQKQEAPLDKVSVDFSYVLLHHKRIIWYLLELEHFVNNIIDLQRNSGSRLMLIQHLRQLERTIREWNYLVQEILPNNRPHKVVPQ